MEKTMFAPITPTKPKITLAEYHAFCDLPENQNRTFELIEGEFVEKMASWKPSEIAMLIGYFFITYLRENPIGSITGEQGGYVINEDTIFMPDVAYVSYERLGAEPRREALVAPDIAIEIKSPSDTKRALRKKMEIYIANGTKIAWLIFPDEQIVEVYTQHDDVITLGIDDVLSGSDVLPNFTLAIKDVLK
jgi:Uma2 family endonuclease